ncbi:polysaccharide biosynthesis/export family protein [Rhodovulum sulfidophilum]|uniref:polysaccharide biosynthesis/export family protein n=1 Tax=Rhodovulum sulfidophilum TaxID=35806 RepID=UPI001EED043F|nr:polysaccharide biosynthesis/export family protein [Rhodovulum sulfidophilum]
MRPRLAPMFFALALCGALSGCATGFVRFPVTEEGQSKLPADVQVIRLDSSNIASFSQPARPPQPTTLPPARDWDYRIGEGDVLSVVVFDHPELTLPLGDERGALDFGFRVQSDGTFFYPFIGQVAARGRRPEEVRADLTRQLADYISDPQLEVRVTGFNSQRVVVAGEVGTPNRQPLTTIPLTLIEAVNAAGGLTELADAERVTVQRGGRLYRVDLDGFLTAGIARNNPLLIAGDTVAVPRRRAEEAYILGEVDTPSPVDLSQEPITLTQAVARSGGIDELRADARGLFVFRGRKDGITVFQLDVSSPGGMLLGTRFLLAPRDVVYITRSPLQRWNDTITGILPTVRTVGQIDDIGD